MQRKRDERQREVKQKAEEELKFLEASGKVKKKTSKKATKKPASQNGKLASGGDMEPVNQHATAMNERPGTASSVGKKVEDIFQSVSLLLDFFIFIVHYYHNNISLFIMRSFAMFAVQCYTGFYTSHTYME